MGVSKGMKTAAKIVELFDTLDEADRTYALSRMIPLHEKKSETEAAAMVAGN